jgi:hypothetical protein
MARRKIGVILHLTALLQPRPAIGARGAMVRRARLAPSRLFLPGLTGRQPGAG